MLKIKNLIAFVGDKKIIDGISMDIKDGEIHTIMGQNGTGKSTICKLIMGDDEYQIKSGDIVFNNESLLKMAPNERAQRGIFLINQSPLAIEGVTNAELLRAVLKEKNGKPVNIFEFNKEMENICEKLDLPKSFIHREINLGSSGGERKKTELLHMWMLKPSFIILDEIDSGLDVDALKLCAKSIRKYYEEYKPSILIVTHHTDLLNILEPDKVHIMEKGKIIKSGDKELAKNIEKFGFSKINQLSEINDYE